MHPTINYALCLLHSLYDKGLSYLSLNTAHSAIYNFENHYNQLNHTSVGKHLLICRYRKGIFNNQKPIPKYNTIWSVDLVLGYLSSLWSLDKLSLKELT